VKRIVIALTAAVVAFVAVAPAEAGVASRLARAAARWLWRGTARETAEAAAGRAVDVMSRRVAVGGGVAEAARRTRPVVVRSVESAGALARLGRPVAHVGAAAPARPGRTGAVFEAVGRVGGRTADFVWRHKAGLTVGAALAAFVANPAPFLDAARALLGALARSMAAAPGAVMGWAAGSPVNAAGLVVLALLICPTAGLVRRALRTAVVLVCRPSRRRS
jgi:hypothetical protein